ADSGRLRQGAGPHDPAEPECIRRRVPRDRAPAAKSARHPAGIVRVWLRPADGGDPPGRTLSRLAQSRARLFFFAHFRFAFARFALASLFLQRLPLTEPAMCSTAPESQTEAFRGTSR